MVEACERRILEFPLEMNARDVAKELKREGTLSASDSGPTPRRAKSDFLSVVATIPSLLTKDLVYANAHWQLRLVGTPRLLLVFSWIVRSCP